MITLGVLAWTAWAALIVSLIICMILTASTDPKSASNGNIVFVVVCWLIFALGFISTVFLTAAAALT